MFRHHITTKVHTCHDITAVVPCAKFHSYHLTTVLMRTKWNFHSIWIKKENLYMKWAPEYDQTCVALPIANISHVSQQDIWPATYGYAFPLRLSVFYLSDPYVKLRNEIDGFAIWERSLFSKIEICIRVMVVQLVTVNQMLMLAAGLHVSHVSPVICIIPVNIIEMWMSKFQREMLKGLLSYIVWRQNLLLALRALVGAIPARVKFTIGNSKHCVHSSSTLTRVVWNSRTLCTKYGDQVVFPAWACL